MAKIVAEMKDCNDKKAKYEELFNEYARKVRECEGELAELTKRLMGLKS